MLLIGAIATVALQIACYTPEPAPAKVDAAIVLGAAVWQGQPSPVFEERIKHGIQLVQSQAVDYLILTGSVGAGDIHAESAVAYQYALAAGVPPQRMLTEATSTVTAENLAEACALMKQHRLGNALIVSDPLHMKRAMTLAEDIGLAAYASPTPTSRYRSWNTKAKSLAYETFFYLTHLVSRLAGSTPHCAS
ncbi:YdcF family protein [Pseudomonas sp. PDM16]|uniref:YdcF family protein n=1 Tax=Pseudomonas sp. PDM16 TaxID=2769292 RepID=UPI00178681E5|nr:YdcF family protein [Pseudomonas sp. PDM16]MBD9416101.1 YdcF family protein [Pseudomonas sp. PDM16]